MDGQSPIRENLLQAHHRLSPLCDIRIQFRSQGFYTLRFQAEDLGLKRCEIMRPLAALRNFRDPLPGFFRQQPFTGHLLEAAQIPDPGSVFTEDLQSLTVYYLLFSPGPLLPDEIRD